MNSGIFHSTYKADMALRHTHLEKARWVIFGIFMLVFPFTANRYFLTLANQIGIATIGAIGLNILSLLVHGTHTIVAFSYSSLKSLANMHNSSSSSAMATFATPSACGSDIRIFPNSVGK